VRTPDEEALDHTDPVQGLDDHAGLAALAEAAQLVRRQRSAARSNRGIGVAPAWLAEREVQAGSVCHRD
jgi:hypothetical protein